MELGINMDILEIAEEAVKARQGNKPKYDEAHVVMALEIIMQEQPIGRMSIMKRLDLSEAPTKTLVKRLRELNVIKVDKVGGAELTELGKKAVEEWKRAVSIHSARLNSINWDTMEIVISGGVKILERMGIINLRDAIIKNGAESTLIAVVTDKGIELPPKTDELSMGNLLQEIRESCPTCVPEDLIVFVTPQNKYIAYKVAVNLVKYEGRVSS